MILVKWKGRPSITSSLRYLSSKNENNRSEAPVKTPKDESKEKVAESKINLKEIDGPKGKEPTRYGDWERKGRVSDF